MAFLYSLYPDSFPPPCASSLLFPVLNSPFITGRLLTLDSVKIKHPNSSLDFDDQGKRLGDCCSSNNLVIIFHSVDRSHGTGK